MNISELSLKRPVLATVMSIALILFGVIGFNFLGIREYPAIDPPLISVNTSYAGANADIIESQITEPLEKSINGIPGIRTITSSSSVGSSNISVEFNLSTNLEAAANDVRDKVSQAVRNLPQDIDAPPVVTKADANSDFIVLMAVQSPSKGLLELSDYAENVLQNKFQTIPEVSSVNIVGQKRPAMRLWIDPDKLNEYGITFNDITTMPSYFVRKVVIHDQYPVTTIVTGDVPASSTMQVIAVAVGDDVIGSAYRYGETPISEIDKVRTPVDNKSWYMPPSLTNTDTYVTDT